MKTTAIIKPMKNPIVSVYFKSTAHIVTFPCWILSSSPVCIKTPLLQDQLSTVDSITLARVSPSVDV